MKTASLVLIYLLLTIPCLARTITVDDDGSAEFDNIQAAIDDSNDGDTIIVRDGTYTGGGNRDIDFLGKAITLRSENGPENCIVDCQGTEAEPHRGFYFHSGEDANSIVKGFTITNGYDGNGGGVYCDESSPAISNCNIVDNYGFGGGIYCLNSSPEITNCVISDNNAPCYFYDPLWICVDGGGIAMELSSPTIRNCVISGNRTSAYGGGVSCYRGNPVIENCTIAGNFADSDGGGLRCVRDCVMTVRNCILSGNTASSGPQISLERMLGDCPTVTISYSVVEGGQGQIDTGECPSGVDWGAGNGDTEPNFADPCGGDYHLQSVAGRWDPNSQSWVTDSNTSPCIDAGNPGCPLGDEPNDPNNVRINMGAYGGTAEASKSPANWALLADLTNDRIVDFDDLAAFVNYWLDTGECVPSDLNRNQSVDFADFAIMALHWLECTGPECGVQVTDVKIIRCELTEDGFQEIEEVDEVRVGDIFIIVVEVSNFGSETEHVLNLYGWDLSPEDCVEVIGSPILCATYYELQPGESAVLSPFCSSQAFRAQRDGRVTMNIQVKDWYSTMLCEDTFTFEVLPEE